jgi:hypothetical protein
MSDNTGSTENPRGPARRTFNPLNWLVGLVAVLVLIAVGFTGAALKNNNNTKGASPATISVTGTATVKGTPDTVSFQIGMETINVNAATALSMNNGRVKALEAALMKHGVTKKEMQTSGLDIQANTNNAGQVTGFTVDDDLTVTMHDLAKAGAAIESAAQAGGNGVELNGITEASNIATAGGTSLTGILKVTDQENQNSPFPEPVTFAAAATAVRSVPLQAGSESLSVQVSVVYSLAN